MELEDQMATYSHDISTLEEEIHQLEGRVGNLTKQDVESAKGQLEKCAGNYLSYRGKGGEDEP